MGNRVHALRMIEEFSSVAREFPFRFAFKFQFRDIDNFIHPDYRTRMDVPYVERFTNTRLPLEHVKELKENIENYGFLTICTPFDEVSVDHVMELDFAAIKIASCSFNDWPLLEKIILTDKPMIASTAGASTETIDNVVSFFHHRQKQFALMHCVGEYPTAARYLQMNQIDYFRQRYPDVPIGYSTHESPENTSSIQLAIAKGAMIFEKHIAIDTERYPKNAYSATPDQVRRWLESAQAAFEMCGVQNRRRDASEKELADLRRFKRGVFMKIAAEPGTQVTTNNTFFAFPNQPGQLLANDMSKYTSFKVKKKLEANEPVLHKQVDAVEIREKIYAIVKKVRKILKEGNIVFPGRASLEISHHYGIDQFHQFGSTMITVVNREYCKKLVIMLPGQTHPEQYHNLKEETFVILHGDIRFKSNGVLKVCLTGDVVTIHPGEKHEFSSTGGAVVEEISSTHTSDDSYYTDPTISQNKNRKTYLTHWIDD